jgi:hypothetical protein
VESKDAIAQVAAISADDPEIGALIAMPWKRLAAMESSPSKNPVSWYFSGSSRRNEF